MTFTSSVHIRGRGGFISIFAFSFFLSVVALIFGFFMRSVVNNQRDSYKGYLDAEAIVVKIEEIPSKEESKYTVNYFDESSNPHSTTFLINRAGLNLGDVMDIKYDKNNPDTAVPYYPKDEATVETISTICLFVGFTIIVTVVSCTLLVKF